MSPLPTVSALHLPSHPPPSSIMDNLPPSLQGKQKPLEGNALCFGYPQPVCSCTQGPGPFLISPRDRSRPPHPGTSSRPPLTQGPGPVLLSPRDSSCPLHPGISPILCTQGPGSILLCTQVQVPSSTPRYRFCPAPDADPAALTHTMTCHI